jgi:gas vesicle protein
MSDRDGNGILWFLLGTGVGIAAGMLFAPQSGNETREILMAKADEGREFVRKRAQEAKEQAAEWAERGKDVLNQQKEQVRSAVEAGKQAYREKTSVESST